MKSFCLKSLAIVCALACGSVFAQNSQQTAMDKFNELINAGIFMGTSDGNNQPLDEDMTRGTAATIVARLVGLDTTSPSSTPSFSDGDSAQPWYSYIQAATTAGIIIGNQETPTFSPTDEWASGDVTQIVANLLGGSSGTGADTTGGQDISSWVLQYVQAASAAGLIHENNDKSNTATRGSLVNTAYAPNPTAAPSAAGTTENTKGETVPEDPTETLKSEFEKIMGMINSTPPLYPGASPGPGIIGSIQEMANQQMGLPNAGGGNNPDDPDNQLALADNNVGNDISLDGMMNEAVDNTITGSIIGTYSGGLNGYIADTSVGGIMTLNVGLTGAGEFDGNVTFNSGAHGTVTLMEGFYDNSNGVFSNSYSSTSTGVTVGSSHYDYANMNVKGAISGTKANGNWDIFLIDSSDPSAPVDGDGTFTTTKK